MTRIVSKFRFNTKDYCIQQAKTESDANRPKSLTPPPPPAGTSFNVG